jgi:hypothetical protein
VQERALDAVRLDCTPLDGKSPIPSVGPAISTHPFCAACYTMSAQSQLIVDCVAPRPNKLFNCGRKKSAATRETSSRWIEIPSAIFSMQQWPKNERRGSSFRICHQSGDGRNILTLFISFAGREFVSTDELLLAITELTGSIERAELESVVDA